ncbi:MAG: hypothetical protein WD065_17815 [Planctomycetaceae bacterium]
MKRSTTTPKILLAFILAVGIAAVWMISLAFIGEGLGLGGIRSYEILQFNLQGEPVINSYDNVHQTRTFRTPEGVPIDLPNEYSWLTEVQALGARRDSSRDVVGESYPFIIPLTDGGNPAKYWYYMQERHAGATGYFVGYDSLSKAVVGYYGRNGFSTSPPADPEGRFESPYNQSGSWNAVVSKNAAYFGGGIYEPRDSWSTGSRDFRDAEVYLFDADRVVKIDLREKDSSSQTLFSADGLISLVLQVGRQYETNEEEPAASRNKVMHVQNDVLIASTANEIISFNPVDETVVRIPRPDELRGKNVAVLRPTTGNYMLREQHFDRRTGTATNFIYTVLPDGQVLNRRKIVTNRSSDETELMMLMMSVLMPHPLGSTLFTGILLPMQYTEMDQAPTYAAALRRSVGEGWLLLVITYTLSIILACRAGVRQRRYGDPVIIPWVIFILITGAPGYLGYLAHRRWPVRLACPSCAAKSPRDRNACLDCGLEFPPPEMKGIEVFA